MQALKDAAVLLILGVLLISVRITPLRQVDLIPTAEAAEVAQEEALERPEANRPASVESSGVDCPARLQTELCRTTDQGLTICILGPDGLPPADRDARVRQRVAVRNVDCT